MPTICSFRSIENKHDVCRGKDCMKKFCEFLREHVMKVINLKNKKMKLLTKEEQESYKNSKICYICKEKFENKYLKDKKYLKVRDHYTVEYRGTAHSICNLKYSVPKKNPIVFHEGSNYDYQFIIKDLVEEFKKQFTCFGENTEKCITFTVPIEREVTRIDKNGQNVTKIYLTYYNLLIAQDLWQVHYQLLSTIFLRLFLELNVNLDTLIKMCNIQN